VRPKGPVFAAALVGAAALAILPAATAHADTSASLPQLTASHQIVVDDAAGYVFISDGPSTIHVAQEGWVNTGAIVVTSLSGGYVATLDAGDGVEGLALSPDGSTLYAALANSDAIAVIDAATLSQTTQYPLPSSVAAPYDLALQSGKLWVSYEATQGGIGGSGAIGDFDLSAATPTFAAQPGMLDSWQHFWYSAPALGSDPSDTGVLVAVQEDESSAEAVSYDVAADPVTDLGAATQVNGCFDDGATVFPGGAQFVVCGDNYSTTTMAQLAGGNPRGAAASAVAPDGLEALGGTDLYVYQPGATSPVNTYTLPDATTVAPSGLAFSSDGSTLYAVGENQGTGTYSLDVLDDPGTQHSFLTLSGPSSVFGGVGYTLTGSLVLPAGVPPTGTQVTISQTQAGSTAAPTVSTVSTAANGSFSLAQNPAGPGTYTYSASYAGGENAPSATATATVTVKRSTSWLQLNGAGARILVGQSFTLNGELALNTSPASARSAPPTGTSITITRTGPGTAATRFVVKTDAAGNYTLTDHLPDVGKYTYAASYAGNADIAPATASNAVTAQLPLPSVGVTASASSIGYQGAVTVTGHLGKTYTNRKLAIYAQTVGSTAEKLIKWGTVNAQGNLSVRYTASYSTQFIVKFTGDARYAQSLAVRTVGVGVRISMTNSGYYATKVENGVTYRVYHHTADLSAHTTVVPGKSGRCVDLQVQQYDPQGKTWFANSTLGCYDLASNSEVGVSVGLTDAAGALYRVRADFLPRSGDNNIATDGAWFYFDVVQ
jgi:YVTN family beta-propeller protein